MTTRITSVNQALELLVPPFEDGGGDWDEILATADLRDTSSSGFSRRRAHRRRFMIAAFALAVALLIVVSALAASGLNPFSSFRAWFSGKPGRPASPSAQREFRSVNGQSWNAFPTGTKLRLLLSRNVDGVRYVLYGFRSGNSLCLTLDAGPRQYNSFRPGCAAASTLAHQRASILPIVADGGVGGSRFAPPPEVSFGIVADGVSAVQVHATDGSHLAWVGGDAYLWVEAWPNSGNRVLSLTGTARGAKSTVHVPALNNFLAPAPQAVPRGPSRLQATIAHPTIGWLDRHEPVGLAPSQLKTYPQIRRLIAASGFTRFIKPDPLSNVIVGVSARRLFYRGGLWGGSNPPYFNRGPLHLFFPPEQPSQGFVTLAGIAADGVAQIKVFLADGQIQAASLKDNVFTALVPRSAPVRVVAYNRSNRVVGVLTLKQLELPTGPVLPTAASRHLIPILTMHAPNGATTTLSAGPLVNNIRCWRASFSNGATQSACQQQIPAGRQVGMRAIQLIGGVQPVGRDIFILARTQPPVERAELRFTNGDTISARPLDGFVIFAVPRNHLSTTQQHAVLLAYDRRSHEITGITYENGHQVSATPLLPQRVRGKLANRLQAAVYFRANP